jgi:hypothetical protein
MEFIEYLGNLCVAMDNKQYKVRNVNIMEIGNHGVLELTVISRHDDIIIGRMGSYDFDALKSDLDKYNEKCPMVGISEDSRYVFKSKDSDENIVFITSPNSDISLSLSDDFDKNIIRQDVFRDDHNEINKSNAFTVTDGLYINPNEIGNVEVTETWLLNLLRILQSNDKYKTVEKHPEIENFEVTTYYISTDIIPIFMLPLISNYYNSEYIERDLNLLQLNFLVPVYDCSEVITYVKLKK